MFHTLPDGRFQYTSIESRTPSTRSIDDKQPSVGVVRGNDSLANGWGGESPFALDFKVTQESNIVAFLVHDRPKTKKGKKELTAESGQTFRVRAKSQLDPCPCPKEPDHQTTSLPRESYRYIYNHIG